MNRHIFRIHSTLAGDRPQIDFTALKNRRNDWGKLDEILLGERDVDAYDTIEVSVRHPEAKSWDLYSVPGTLGLISQRAVATVGNSAFSSFKLLPASLNNAPYYLLKVESRTDCLNREGSQIVYFTSDPKSIESVTLFAFHRDKIPDHTFFAIPELIVELFATSSVEAVIRDSHLKGIQASVVW